jgi:hypothetical protein
VRADSLAELDGAFARVRACFEAGALAAGCTWELTETSPRYAEFRNDEQLATLFAANAAGLGRDMDAAETGPRGMAAASTDIETSRSGSEPSTPTSASARCPRSTASPPSPPPP